MSDNAAFADELDYALLGQNFAINRAVTYNQARILMNQLQPDVLLIDGALSDRPAADVCGRVRDRDPEVVVIVLAADASAEEKLLGFEAGADDYLTSPFGYWELAARMNAKLRRSRRYKKRQMVEVGYLRIDPIRHEASLAGHELALRPKEFAILAALASSPRTTWTREELAREVWWPERLKSLHTIDVHVHGTRLALARHSSHGFIRNVPGVGFRFVPEYPG